MIQAEIPLQKYWLMVYSHPSGIVIYMPSSPLERDTISNIVASTSFWYYRVALPEAGQKCTLKPINVNISPKGPQGLYFPVDNRGNLR